jgi:hypothetical protein
MGTGQWYIIKWGVPDLVPAFKLKYAGRLHCATGQNEAKQAVAVRRISGKAIEPGPSRIGLEQ